jgi:hypothetical protein
MYSTIGSGTASQATPQGRRHKRAEAGFELAIIRPEYRFVHPAPTLSQGDKYSEINIRQKNSNPSL